MRAIPCMEGFLFIFPSVFISPSSTPPPTPLRPTNNNISSFLWPASTQHLSFSCDFSDHQDAGLKGSSVKHWPATTTSCIRQPSEEFGFKALLSSAFGVAVTSCECVWSGWWNHQNIPLQSECYFSTLTSAVSMLWLISVEEEDEIINHMTGVDNYFYCHVCILKCLPVT